MCLVVGLPIEVFVQKFPLCEFRVFEWDHWLCQMCLCASLAGILNSRFLRKLSENSAMGLVEISRFDLDSSARPIQIRIFIVRGTLLLFYHSLHFFLLLLSFYFEIVEIVPISLKKKI